MTNPDLKALFGPIAVTTLALVVCTGPALGADSFFGTESPLLKFVDFIVGPFAYAVVIIALVITVGVLAIGGEFSGFARRMPIVVVAGGIVILAGDVISNLFGANRAADMPRRFPLSPLSDGQGAPWMVIVLLLILMLVLVYALAACGRSQKALLAEVKRHLDALRAALAEMDVGRQIIANSRSDAIQPHENNSQGKGAEPE